MSPDRMQKLCYDLNLAKPSMTLTKQVIAQRKQPFLGGRFDPKIRGRLPNAPPPSLQEEDIFGARKLNLFTFLFFKDGPFPVSFSFIFVFSLYSKI